jgi:hypothetical protein
MMTDRPFQIRVVHDGHDGFVEFELPGSLIARAPVNVRKEAWVQHTIPRTLGQIVGPDPSPEGGSGGNQAAFVNKG